MKERTIKEQIIDYVMEYMEKINFNKSTPLPSEWFLVNKFKTSRSTVRVAMQALLNEGTVSTFKGSGYFVSENANFNKIKSVGKDLAVSKQKILLDENISINDMIKILDNLNLNIKSINIYDFIPYVKLFYVQNKTVRYSKSFLNKNLFEQIMFNKIEKSLIDFVINEGVKIKKQVFKVNTAFKTTNDLKLLDADDQNMIINVYSILYDDKNNIIEISEHHSLLSFYETTFIKQI